jgi:hypothetical protein
VETIEDELREGPEDGGGVATGGARDVGAVYLEVVGAGVAHEMVALIVAETMTRYDLQKY